MLAYFDCFSGISGDMTLAALHDLGVPLDWLKDQLSRLPLRDFDVTVTSAQRNGIHAKLLQVKTADRHTARNYSPIRTLIDTSPLTDNVKTTSLQIFRRLAEAEARIHSCSLEKVHFHEVGGLDAIVDIVGTALGLEYLAVEKIIASPIPLGKGFVTCSHGKLPVPVPATLGILKDIPVYGTGIPHELVTPTGAAIISVAAKSFQEIPDMTIKKIGYGAGQRDLAERPNLLRIILGEEMPPAADPAEESQEDQIEIVETNIDDMNPEFYGHLMELLFDEGALDVCWMPVFMKKSRPGTILQVLCKKDRREGLINRILSETTTLGVRYHETRRRLLWREQLDLETSYGKIAVKRIKDPRGNFRIVPEYDVCQRIARERDLPLRVVYDTVAREAAQWIEK